jgi:hypothetical protein
MSSTCCRREANNFNILLARSVDEGGDGRDSGGFDYCGSSTQEMIAKNTPLLRSLSPGFNSKDATFGVLIYVCPNVLHIRRGVPLLCLFNAIKANDANPLEWDGGVPSRNTVMSFVATSKCPPFFSIIAGPLSRTLAL